VSLEPKEGTGMIDPLTSQVRLTSHGLTAALSVCGAPECFTGCQGFACAICLLKRGIFPQ
jgi:hypothetical protein